MLNPKVAAIIIELLCMLAVLFGANRLGVSRRTAFIIGLVCLPVPIVFVAFRAIFVFDIVAPIVLVMVFVTEWRTVSSVRTLVTIYGTGVVLWPLFATILSIYTLNEQSSFADCAFFLLRSIFALGTFVWANGIARRSGTVKAFVVIPMLFWVVFAVLGVAEFAGIVDTNTFWAYHDPENIRHLTTGFMGMDAPQISVWATLGVASALWLSGTTGGLVKWLLLCVPGVSVVLCVFVGSRQGVIGCGLAILLTSIVTLTGRSGMRRVAFMAVAIAIAVASGFLYWDKLDAEQRNNITSRFLVLGTIHSASDALDARDSSTKYLIQYIASNGWRLVFGSGVATECPVGCDVRTYAEGEFVRILWAGGLISLLAYCATLYMLVKRSLTIMLHRSRAQTNGRPALLFIVVMICSFFCLGQFNLFTNFESNVPIYYVLWLVIGALYCGNGIGAERDVLRLSCETISARRVPSGVSIA